MDLQFLISEMEAFLGDLCDKDTFIENIQKVEDDLLELESNINKEDSAGRDIIRNTMEIIDNIYLLLEENESEKKAFEIELEKLIKIQFPFSKIRIEKGNNYNSVISSGEREMEKIQKTGEGSFIGGHRGFAFQSQIKDKLPPRDYSFPPSPSREIYVRRPEGIEFYSQTKGTLSFGINPDNLSKKDELYIPPPSKFEFNPEKSTLIEEELQDNGDLSNINLKSSPLYGLLNTSKSYSFGKVSLMDFENELENTRLDLDDLKKDVLEGSGQNSLKEDLIFIIEEIQEELSYVSESMGNRIVQSELNDFIELLEALNQKFIILNQKFFHKESGEKEIIDRVLERIPAEDFITGNYERIKETGEKFFNEEIGEEEFKRRIDDMLDLIRNCRREYEDTYISPEEWTLEVATGDKVLLEGLNEWERGLMSLNDSMGLMDEDSLKRAMDKIYEGNKKLVINQYLALYVREQARFLDKFKEIKHQGI